MKIDPIEIVRWMLEANLIPDQRAAAKAHSVVERQIESYELKMHYGESSLVKSAGEPFHAVGILLTGSLMPMTVPVSLLKSPFVFGLHEFLMDDPDQAWISSYFRLGAAAVMWIPKECLRELCVEVPSIERTITKTVLQRFARFCWTSLSVSTSPEHRVMAAIISRAVLSSGLSEITKTEVLFESHGMRRELMRLTTLSRTALFKVLADKNFKKFVRTSERANEETVSFLDLRKMIGAIESEFEKDHISNSQTSG